MTTQPVLSDRHCAKLFRVALRTVWKWCDCGRLPILPREPGAARQVTVTALRAFARQYGSLDDIARVDRGLADLQLT